MKYWPYLFVVGLFGLFACNNLLTRGMFMDGLIYTSVAANMAEGVGSFWHPVYTATQFPDFYEHPPLMMWLLSLWGRIPLFIGMTLMNWMGIAVTCMAREARGVEKALDRGLPDARKQVARIVGRDTQNLNEEEIIKATVETVAENTTDGVISPMFWALLGGPVLLWGFKAVNTLDSMVGYMDEKYRDIGWSSARLDDIMNYIPARMTAVLMICAAYLTGLDGRNAFRIVRRDHRNYKSPNCAWSEAVAAGALHLQLGGTHDYFGKPVDKPTIGDADRPAEQKDIRRANRLLYVTGGLMTILITAAGLFL